MNLARTLPFLALLLPMVTGCAVNADPEDDPASTEDELKSLSTSVVVGTLREDMEAMRTDAPTDSGYRAFQFQANEGSEHVAYVVTTNATDPVAYILDANRRMLKRNDDRGAAMKDAEIRFKAPKTGTYYLAFRTKERRPATVMARLLSTSSDDPRPTGTYADGWPVHSRYWGRPDRTVFDLQVRAEGGTVITNYDGCPADPFTANRGSTMAAQLSLRVDLANKRVSMSAGNAGGSSPIAPDGSFLIESRDGRWGTVRARGRLAPGGIAVVDAGESIACHSNYTGNYVYNANRVANAIGATDTN